MVPGSNCLPGSYIVIQHQSDCKDNNTNYCELYKSTGKARQFYLSKKPLKIAVCQAVFAAILKPVRRNLSAQSYNWYGTDCGTRRDASCSSGMLYICVRGGIAGMLFAYIVT